MTSFFIVNVTATSKGNVGSAGAGTPYKTGWKICKVLLQTNKKLYKHFRLVPKSSMALNGRYTVYCRKDASLDAHHNNANEDRPVLHYIPCKILTTTFFMFSYDILCFKKSGFTSIVIIVNFVMLK